MMADGGETGQLKARLVGAIDDIDAKAWNALANPPDRPFDPFVSHEFLRALEKSESASPAAGWTPRHLALEAGGELVGAAPAYLKTHSYGEYVFDHHWADAFERAGGRYYPKLLCAIPFTPVPGPRLLARTAERRAALALTLVELSRRLGVSSAHVNFVGSADAAILKEAGFLPRTGVQFHWINRGYETHEDFLAALSSRKRKAVRRERREAAADLTIRRVEGRDIGEDLWDAFWEFYQDTGGRKWGRPYLTRGFFSEISDAMPERLLMVVAQAGDRTIAGALNFIGGDALYGRYWGRAEDRPFLHFELCYHQAIEFAIERGLSRVEAGAQGEHKIARGYEPVMTHSAHWIGDPAFRNALDDYLARERRNVEAEIAALEGFAPFRRGQ